MVTCRSEPFAFSPLNALPKIALGKWTPRPLKGALALISVDGVHRVMPLDGPDLYYAAILDLLQERKTLSLVPEWIATALKKHHKVTKQHDEYVMETPDVRALPGGRNAALRGNVNKARRLCSIEALSSERLDEYLALNALWYKQNAVIKFRPYDKTSIDWLLRNWPLVREAVPDAVCLGVRSIASAQLISLNLGCALSDAAWTAYTQRFDRGAPIKAANMFGYAELAGVFASLPMENDGTADTKTIREWKDRLVARKVPYFIVSP
jgi:hypothetical protein